ncbi:uncharacterized protein LOC107647592 [Arachis ipaensis]|uniref:uncharacterized protein LOC107647592 n=1 Tax=Arachis ipaensis TaxID=130454 RepID=UPI0007AF9C22|nr:uncharacterized protein LOC107647592 [Arachis ipaensis]
MGDLITCLIIYVDDMIITGSDAEEIEKLRRNIFTDFEMKDLGRLKYFLGIEVLQSSKGIFISQRKYILDLLAETRMVDCKSIDTPMQVNHKLKIVEGAILADKERYQRVIEKLIYLSHTQPDIAYAMGIVSQFMHKPQEDHMEAAMRIVRYLKGAPGSGIIFKRNGHLKVEAYTDADWADNQNDRRSTTGYFTLVGGNLEASPLIGIQDGLVNKIQKEEAIDLERMPSADEIKEAVWDCESSKAPGCDG